MARRDARCPQCHASYPWGTTVCPACHVGLDLLGGEPRARPTALIFETWDRPSVDVVVSLLEAHGLRCLILRGVSDLVGEGGGEAYGKLEVPRVRPLAQSRRSCCGPYATSGHSA